MIDIENAKRVFKEYVKDYNPNDGKIALKISHILRVTQKSRELMHAKIIRDADKLDIYYVLTIEKLENSYGCKDMSKDEITDEIYREFMEDHMINYKNLKTNADMLVAHIAYIFDFYYNYSLKIVKQKGYIEQIEQKVNLENKQAIKLLEKINVIANNYIDETLKLEQREQVQCQKSC